MGRNVFIVILYFVTLFVACTCMAGESGINPSLKPSAPEDMKYVSGEWRFYLNGTLPQYDRQSLAISSDEYFIRNGAAAVKIDFNINPTEERYSLNKQLKDMLKELDVPVFARDNWSIKLNVRGSRYMAMMRYNFM